MARKTGMAPRRPRSEYRTETHTTNTSTNGGGTPSWLASIATSIVPMLITVAMGGVITLFVWQVSGSQTVNEHSKKFDAYEKKWDDLLTKLGEIKREDEGRRNGLRDEFLKRSEQTADGIAKLNTQAAVQDNTMKQMLAQLEKLNLRMETITTILPQTVKK